MVVISQKKKTHMRLLEKTRPNIAAMKAKVTKKNIPCRSRTSGWWW